MRWPLFRIVAVVAVGVALATAVAISAPRGRQVGRERDRVIRTARGGTLRLDAGDALHHDADILERLFIGGTTVAAAGDGHVARVAPRGGVAMPGSLPAMAPPGGGAALVELAVLALPTQTRSTHSGRAPPLHN